MPKFIFHVGMGKTGSTTIQAALAENTSALAANGYLYLGQWLGIVRPEFDEFAGFQSFLEQSPREFDIASYLFLRATEDINISRKFDKFIVSNEQYLENVIKTEPFFRGISRRGELEIIIYVRPPATWLPSAYMQWGVIHKTNIGHLESFSVQARELMKQYGYIRQWRETFGSAVTVRSFDDRLDVVKDISSYIQVELVSRLGRHQGRPGVSEALLRGMCNNIYPGIAFPEFYNEILARGIPAGTPRSLSDKFSFMFDISDIPEIIAENQETISYIEQEFGLDMSSHDAPLQGNFNLSELTNDILGTMMDLVFSQAHQIKGLSSRLEELERQNKPR
ncbi:MAG: hypothetical protein ABIK36_18605 [Pseudomonadota bacterium]